MVITIHNRWYPIILLLDDIQFDQQICDMQCSSDIVVVEHFKLDLCSNFAICFMGIKENLNFFIAYEYATSGIYLSIEVWIIWYDLICSKQI